jgi:hypothetical protein
MVDSNMAVKGEVGFDFPEANETHRQTNKTKQKKVVGLDRVTG